MPEVAKSVYRLSMPIYAMAHLKLFAHCHTILVSRNFGISSGESIARSCNRGEAISVLKEPLVCFCIRGQKSVIRIQLPQEPLVVVLCCFQCRFAVSARHLLNELRQSVVQ